MHLKNKSKFAQKMKTKGKNSKSENFTKEKKATATETTFLHQKWNRKLHTKRETKTVNTQKSVSLLKINLVKYDDVSISCRPRITVN